MGAEFLKKGKFLIFRFWRCQIWDEVPNVLGFSMKLRNV